MPSVPTSLPLFMPFIALIISVLEITGLHPLSRCSSRSAPMCFKCRHLRRSTGRSFTHGWYLLCFYCVTLDWSRNEYKIQLVTFCLSLLPHKPHCLSFHFLLCFKALPDVMLSCVAVRLFLTEIRKVQWCVPAAAHRAQTMYKSSDNGPATRRWLWLTAAVCDGWTVLTADD